MDRGQSKRASLGVTLGRGLLHLCFLTRKTASQRTQVVEDLVAPCPPQSIAELSTLLHPAQGSIKSPGFLSRPAWATAVEERAPHLAVTTEATFRVRPCTGPFTQGGNVPWLAGTILGYRGNFS